MNRLGYWWSAPDIEIHEIEGRFIALEGWNGEIYLNCWEVEEMVGDEGFGIRADGIIVRPIYQQCNEGDFEIEGYEILP